MTGALAVGGVVESAEFSLSRVVPRPVQEDDLAHELVITVIRRQGIVAALHTGVLSFQEFVSKAIDEGIERLGLPVTVTGFGGG